MKNRGVLAGAVAAVCFAVMNVFINQTSESSGPAQVVFFRGLIGTLLFTPFVVKEIPKLFRPGSALLWVRFFSGVLSSFALFYNVRISGAAAGLALGKTEAVFVIFFALLLFKQFPKPSEWIGIGCILAGVFSLHAPLIAQAGFGSLAIGLGGAVFGAVALTALKKVVGEFSPLLIVWGFCCTSTALAFPVVGRGAFVFEGNAPVFLCVTGFLGAVGQVLLTKSYAVLPAPVASVVNLSSILWCVLIESICFDLRPGFLALCGYGTILFGLLVLQTAEMRMKKPVS